MSPRKDFFISYTNKDRAWAEWIAWQLEEKGYTIILQHWDFRPGMNFIHMMNTAMDTTERTIAVLSLDYFKSDFATSEWTAVFARDPIGEQGLLVPVRVRECNIAKLLKPMVYIDLVGLDEQSAQNALLTGIDQKRAKPTIPPGFPRSIHQTISERPRFPSALPPIWTLPFEQNPDFTGREEVLQHMYDALHIGKTVALIPPLALTGLGGIGKTQTAVEYAYRYLDDYSEAVMWIRAETNESLTNDFLTLAEKLSIPLPRRRQNEQLKDPILVIEEVKHWLETHDRWLLIFDNVEDLELFQRFRPVAPRGHILLTTRLQAVRGKGVTCVTLEKMSHEEGTLFLLRRTGIISPKEPLDRAKEADRITARAISEQLDGLPLALDQAGAYIEETGCSFSSYLNLYEERRSELLRQRGTSFGHPESVTTTFLLAFEKVKQANIVAADLLRLCAFLSPDAISTELIVNGVSSSRRLRIVAVDFHEAMRDLLRYSLLRPNRKTEKETFTIHRLVQAVLRDTMSKQEQREWAIEALNLFQLRETKALSCFTWFLSDPHLEAFTEHIHTYTIHTSTAASILVARACDLAQQAYVNLQKGSNRERRRYALQEKVAIDIFEEGLIIGKQTQESNHLWRAQALVSFAEVMYLPRKRFSEAYSLYKQIPALNEYLLERENNSLSSLTESSSAMKYLYILCYISRREEAGALIASLRANQDKKTNFGQFLITPLISFVFSFLLFSSLILPSIFAAIQSWSILEIGLLLLSFLGVITAKYFYTYGYFINKKWKIKTKGGDWHLVASGVSIFIGVFWGCIGWFILSPPFLNISFGILRTFLPFIGAFIGFFFGGWCAYGSCEFLLGESLNIPPPFPQVFYTLSFFCISITSGLLFQSWLIPVGIFLLSIVFYFLVGFMSEFKLISEVNNVPIAAILSTLIFTTFCIMLNFIWHIQLLVVTGVYFMSITLWLFMSRATLLNRRTCILIASLLYGIVWSAMGWLIGALISSPLHMLLWPSILLAFICFLIGFISYFRTYHWFNYFIATHL